MKSRTITILLVLFVFACTTYYQLSRQRAEYSKPLSTNELQILVDSASSQPHPPAWNQASNANVSAALFTPPLRTQGRYIIDSTSQRVKLAAINWYGGSDALFVPGGLDVQHRRIIAQTIRRNGFNSVRLPYSDELVAANPYIPHEVLSANPDLQGKRALDVFAAIVSALTDAGLAVIVNNHITAARWCCGANLCDTLWKNTHLGPVCRVQQSEEQWIAHWETIMAPHVDDPLVVGADLRNEVRSVLNAWIWPEWAAAAERAAEHLLAMQPAWLMVVEGTSSANDLSPALRRPILLSVPNRLVYSAHVYGWSGWGKLDPYWGREYDSFRADMRRNWGYLLEQNVAPVWVGEFGGPDTPNKGDLNYWENLVRYLNESDADWGYWAVNPRKPAMNEVESYGLLGDDWSTWKWDYRMADLTALMQASSQP